MSHPSVPAGTKKKLAEAQVNCPVLPPALGMWILGKVNFGAGSSALHTACPGPAHNFY